MWDIFGYVALVMCVCVHVLVRAKFSQHKTQMNDTPKNFNALFPHLFYKVS